MIRWAASEAGRKVGRKGGCAALPTIAGFVGKSMEDEIRSRTREFYEFALPPVDVYADDDRIRVVVDLPGFGKDQIQLRLDGSSLLVRARRKSPDADAVSAQRPNVLEKRIRLPTRIRRGEEPECTTTLSDGVLTVSIPAPGRGRDIPVE